ncbi:30S ribosomal protein S5 [Candidatus Falkowbacteria bacterium CG10_big_fil_rev_8_21_14_0_10_37_14]|uniref:Small ribosomal subunit protein uS5 n=1 Tax=Candidatus Falkowbacteria bacterium CG10_big_fil_rev_8_21_14_0_10_37_14 TaxID=1974561 RepID=A0A2M6WU17_9BACT|nr:30S ribosomal protein S5 [Candidatus Falkowbacteria bacterium]PIT96231.1 MAG: 30S ribosomal protein S5 [Candidatus Falkowbacteria bacterium CG10_big_fil_rev_8_21_14_0_10_37_14]
MTETAKQNNRPTSAARGGVRDGAKPGGQQFNDKNRRRSGGGGGRGRTAQAETEFDQKILDLARVTRVMAGGKRMRFRACLAIGNHKGKVAIGLAKGVDVTAAITKAFNQAKKKLIEVPITNGTIPHQVELKFKASHIILKPAQVGHGVRCGGVVRVLAEMAGISDLSGKMLGTNNNVANAKCMMLALADLRQPRTSAKKLAAAKVATQVTEVAGVETVENKAESFTTAQKPRTPRIKPANA